jgi:hypothetical protein
MMATAASWLMLMMSLLSMSIWDSSVFVSGALSETLEPWRLSRWSQEAYETLQAGPGPQFGTSEGHASAVMLSLLAGKIPKGADSLWCYLGSSPASTEDLHHRVGLARLLGCGIPSTYVDEIRSSLSTEKTLGGMFYAVSAALVAEIPFDIHGMTAAVTSLVDSDGLVAAAPGLIPAAEHSFTAALLLAELLPNEGSSAHSERASALEALSKQLPSSESARFSDARLLAPLSIAGALPTLRARVSSASATHLLSSSYVPGHTWQAVHVLRALRALSGTVHPPISLFVAPATATAEDVRAGRVHIFSVDVLGVPVPGVTGISISSAERLSRKEAHISSRDLQQSSPGKWTLWLSEDCLREPGTLILDIRVSVEWETKAHPAKRAFVLAHPISVSSLKVWEDELEIGGSIGSVHTGAELTVEFHVDEWVVAEATPHQTFVRFSHVESGADVFFVAEPFPGNPSSFSTVVSLSSDTDSFVQGGGTYEVSPVVGDIAAYPSQRSPYPPKVTLVLDFPEKGVAGVWPLYARPLLHESDNALAPLEEKHHTFRAPDRRGPAVVSLVFVLLVLGTLVAFCLSLLSVGANADKMYVGGGGVSGVLFQICLGTILTLFGMYWVGLTMAQLLLWLCPLAVATAFSGRRALISLLAAEQQGQQKQNEPELDS